MRQLITVYKTEFIKLKNSFAFWLIGLGALFIPVFFISNIVFKSKEYIGEFTEENTNPWYEYSRKFFNGVHFTFLPLLLVILIALALNIEYKSNGWKHLFVMPVSRSKIFFGKFLMVQTLIVLFYCLLIIFYLTGGYILGTWNSAFNFINFSPAYRYGGIQTNIGLYILKSYISIQALIAIHFWLSFRLKNTFSVLAIGLGGVVISIGMYIGHWPSLSYLPYGSPLLMCNYIGGHGFLESFLKSSIVYSALLMTGSYFDFVKFFRA